MDVDLSIVIVSDDGTEGKEKDEHGEETGCPRAEDACERILRKGDARRIAADRILSREEHDERCRRADDPRIDVDTERLHQSLLDGVRDVRRRRRIRDRALARLIREESAADAGENGRADTAADRRLWAERIVQNQGKHRGHRIHVQDDDDKGDQEIDARHDGHKERR